MPSFCSFFVFHPHQTELVKSLCTKAGGDVRFIPDPSNRYRFRKNGFSELSQPNSLDETDQWDRSGSPGQLLVIETDQATANNVVQLIGAALTVVDGFPLKQPIPKSGFAIPMQPDEEASIFKNVFQTSGYFEVFTHHTELPLAVAIAAKAWPNTNLIYAIHKLSRSYETESITPWSTHPIHGQIFNKHSNEFLAHVGTSTAINLAFSAIEELQLQVKSSAQNKRWRNNETFEWNPDVLKDIEGRLESAGIATSRKLKWIVRGDKTEPDIEPKRDIVTSIIDGEVVRDIEFSLPDAIHACSYLRNFLTAHAFGSNTTRLGPYEVFNVQNVARFLILSKCGLFNVTTRDLLHGSH